MTTRKSNTMKAMVMQGYGSPDVFKLQEVKRPEPKANEVLVKVMTSAATTADTMMRTGKPYFGRLFTGLTKPKKPIPGTGFAGIVETVGTEVTKYHLGDRVFGMTGFGFSANAEFIVVDNINSEHQAIQLKRQYYQDRTLVHI